MVVVYTAQKFTSLGPHCIDYARENEFTAWLTKHGSRSSITAASCATSWRNLAAKKKSVLRGGASSRVELPEIVARLGGARRVLYTDCDVFFVSDVVHRARGEPV